MLGRRKRHVAEEMKAATHYIPAANSTYLDATCHMRLHSGYAGDGAVVWGGNFKLSSAGECCTACQAHAAVCGKDDSHGKVWWPQRPDMRCGRGLRVCSIWTFCPEEQCFAFDVHRHVRGECWLKFQLSDPTRPKDPFEGHINFPEALRSSPRKIWPWAVEKSLWLGHMPTHIPWTSGVLAPANATIVSAEPNDKWRQRWCTKYGPCE